MAFLSYLPVGIPASNRLVFRPVYPQTVTPFIVTGLRQSGVKRKPIRVRRADFSSQAAYETALKAALQGAAFAYAKPEVAEAIASPRSETRPQIRVTDTAIKVSAADMARLQAASEIEEIALLALFIEIIEDE